MNNKTKGALQILLVVVLIAAFAYVAVAGIGGAHKGKAQNIRLGLDLKGGVSVTYQANKANPTDQEMDDTVYKMQKRVEDVSTEAAVYKEGSNRITIDIPGVSNSAEILKKLGNAGSLQFIMYSDLKAKDGGTSPAEGDEVTFDKKNVKLDGSMIKEAKATTEQDQSTGATENVVEVTFNSKGSKKFGEITEANVGSQMAIVYDNKLVSAPTIKSAITEGKCTISGGFEKFSEAEELASTLRIGALPLELTNIHDNVVGATLGSEALRTSLIAGVIGLIFGCVIAVLTALSFNREIKKLQNATHRVAGGDFSEKIKVTRSDEFGVLETNFNGMMDDVSGLIHAVEDKSNHILEVAGGISEVAGNTKTTIEQVTQAIDSVAQGAVKQAESTQEANTEVEHLKNSLDETKEYVSGMNGMTEKANEVSTEGIESVKDLIEKSGKTAEKSKVSLEVMNEMVESIDKIFYISDTIADITSQTNLLSLNASIEAARAGEMGKGFAVVADEIRKLADESKESTDEIKKIITEITEKSKLVESTMQENEVLQTEQQEAINRTEEIFGEIMKQIEMLGSGMERINALNDTMSANKDLVVDKMGTIASVSEQSAAATEEVNASTEQVNVTMEEISEHTETLQAIAKDLMETINRFKLA